MAAPSSAAPPVRRERSDAQRNRASILAAAREALERDGLNFQIDDIARAAGVGTGTIYRNFPTKQALAEAVLIDGIERRTEEVRAAAESNDPAAALFGFVAGMIERSCANKGLYEVLAAAGIDVHAAKAGASADLWVAAETLLAKAQQAGGVRTDMTIGDLMALLTGTCQAASAYDGNPALLTRIVQDGLRARSA
ncbi:MAG: TetR/AcrR family transcriptional regulator [Chloroflexi bacterium]|nr:TetR/AcrR family transcriptional regulator [Chloroflexota bacterium]